MKGKTCPRTGCNNKAIIDPGLGVLPCKQCQKRDGKTRVSSTEIMPISRYHRVQKQRDRHGKDMLQPFEKGGPNPEFAKAYPKMAEEYFSKEELENL